MKYFEKKIYEKHLTELIYWFSIIKIEDINNITKETIKISDKYILFKYKEEKTIGYLFINGATFDIENEDIMILSGGIDDQVNVFIRIDYKNINYYKFELNEWINDGKFINILDGKILEIN